MQSSVPMYLANFSSRSMCTSEQQTRRQPAWCTFDTVGSGEQETLKRQETLSTNKEGHTGKRYRWHYQNMVLMLLENHELTDCSVEATGAARAHSILHNCLSACRLHQRHEQTPLDCCHGKGARKGAPYAPGTLSLGEREEKKPP